MSGRPRPGRTASAGRAGGRRRPTLLLLALLLAGAPPASAAAPAGPGVRGAALAVRMPAAFAGGTPASRATAPARSWTVARFDAEILVHRSGEVVVTERIVVRFSGRYEGIYRFIPVEYRTPAGFNYTLRLEFESVTDDAGNALRHETRRDGPNREVKVWVPDAADATRTVVIRYRVKNGIRFLREGEQEWDELYWNVTGDEWPVAIEAASARVHLPSMASGLRARAWTGAAGSRERDADVRVQDHIVTTTLLRPLGFREGLTIAVAWDSRLAGAAGPEGEFLVRRPALAEKTWAFLLSNWPLGVPLLVLGLMYAHWRARGRDPELRPIAPEYEPPDGLTPSEAGVLVDNQPDMRDVTAMVVDLAVRGHLRIEETEERKLLGLLRDRSHAFLRRTGPEAWDGLKRHERALLGALFDGGTRERVTVSELENEFYKDLPRIRDAIFDELLARRYYARRPDRVRTAYLVFAAVVAVGVGMVGLAASRRFGTAAFPAILGAGLSGAVMAVFGLFMPARTAAGARVLERVLGFEEFLGRVESDRFRRMITGPEMFERYLPFAMALGVERKWAAAFEGIFQQPPEWYHGGLDGSFRTSLFVSHLSDMSGRTASAMSSAPRGSGGSGFSGGGGGGFSGGGFGGGGGGAF